MSLLMELETHVSSPMQSLDSAHQKNACKDVNHLKDVKGYLSLCPINYQDQKPLNL